MAELKQITNVSKNNVFLERATWCTSFFCKLRGFMFRRSVEPDEALVFVHAKDNKLNSTIHMFFVPFDLGVIWVNNAGEVVDTVIAKPWRPQYAPSKPARYVIETHPDKLKLVSIGDKFTFSTI